MYDRVPNKNSIIVGIMDIENRFRKCIKILYVYDIKGNLHAKHLNNDIIFTVIFLQ